MATQGGKVRIQNRLWGARKRCGLGQKQVAFLIGKTIDEVSRYERGVRLPELPTALAIEVVYGSPLRILFQETFEQALKEIRQRIESRSTLAGSYTELLARTDPEVTQYCAYEEMLKLPVLTVTRRNEIRDHVTTIAKKLAGI